jgi:hypothetical protein
MRSRFSGFALVAVAVIAASTPSLVAQDPNVRVNASLIEGPAEPPDFTKWIGDMKRWRHEQLVRIGYSGAEYDRPELKWTQSSFMQPQMMIEDRYFYDPVSRRCTVDRYLDDLEKRYAASMQSWCGRHIRTSASIAAITLICFTICQEVSRASSRWPLTSIVATSACSSL